MEKFGIINLIGIISLIAILGNVGGKTMENEKIGVEDLALLPELSTAFPILIKTDFSQVFPEAGDLSDVEQAQLIAHFNQKFDIPQDALETKIESVLSIVQKQIGVIQEAIVLFKKPPSVS